MQNLMNEIVKKSICFVKHFEGKKFEGKEKPHRKNILFPKHTFLKVSISVQVCVQIESKQMSLTLCVCMCGICKEHHTTVTTTSNKAKNAAYNHTCVHSNMDMHEHMCSQRILKRICSLSLYLSVAVRSRSVASLGFSPKTH